MSDVGRVESLWRYPVKSMRGEELESAFVGFSGVYGDRIFAFSSPAQPAGFPWVTGREQQTMLLYRPRFRHRSNAEAPTNQAEAEKIGSGLTPMYADSAALVVDVEMPDGKTLAVDDPALASLLREQLGGEHEVTLARSDRALTDCRPVSLFSIQTARQLGEELETESTYVGFAPMSISISDRLPVSPRTGSSGRSWASATGPSSPSSSETRAAR